MVQHLRSINSILQDWYIIFFEPMYRTNMNSIKQVEAKKIDIENYHVERTLKLFFFHARDLLHSEDIGVLL